MNLRLRDDVESRDERGAVNARHTHVHERNVDAIAFDHFKRFDPVRGFCYKVDIVGMLKHELEAFADHPLIVNDHHPDSHAESRLPTGISTVRTASNLPPFCRSKVRLPPRSATRCRSEAKPNPSEGCLRCGAVVQNRETGEVFAIVKFDADVVCSCAADGVCDAFLERPAEDELCALVKDRGRASDLDIE